MVGQLNVNRRALLLGMTAATLGSVLSSCRSDDSSTLAISLLEGSVPAEVLKKFKQQVETPVKFQTLNQLSSLFQQLQQWQSKQEPELSKQAKQLLFWIDDPMEVRPDNLISLDDYWLASAIEQDLIEPFQLEAGVLDKLPADWMQSWQQFIERSVENSAGQAETGASKTSASKTSASKTGANMLWAAPYRVQPLVLVYRQGKIPTTTGQTESFSSWRELLAPALRNRIAMPEHPRLVLGVLQKIRSGSFNPTIESNAIESSAIENDTIESSSARLKAIDLKTTDIEQQLESQLGDLLVEFDRQVKTYDAQNSLKALINGDVDVAVSWLSDTVAAQRRYQDLKIAIPTEGSLLSTDIWVRPKGAAMSKSASDWIGYCWEDGPATQISRGGGGLSPVFLGKEATLPNTLSNDLLLETLRNSEPLLPLPKETQKAYFSFWQRVREG